MKVFKNPKIVAPVLYVFAGLYCLYTIFTIFSTIVYLQSVTSSGMYVSITFSDMLQAFVSQVGPNIVYTLTLFGLGFLVGQTGEQEVLSEPTKEYEKDEPKADYSVTSDSDQTALDDEPVELIDDQVAEEQIILDEPEAEDITLSEGATPDTVDITEEATGLNDEAKSLAEAIEDGDSVGAISDMPEEKENVLVVGPDGTIEGEISEED